MVYIQRYTHHFVNQWYSRLLKNYAFKIANQISKYSFQYTTKHRQTKDKQKHLLKKYTFETGNNFYCTTETQTNEKQTKTCYILHSRIKLLNLRTFINIERKQVNTLIVKSVLSVKKTYKVPGKCMYKGKKTICILVEISLFKNSTF